MEAKIIMFPSSGGGDVGVIEHMLAGGEIVAAQVPSSGSWSREKKLAAAAFTSALINIRDQAASAHPRRLREVTEDVDWVMADDFDWPYSFVRLCELFSMNPAWVRERVNAWLASPQTHTGRRFSAHRHAA